MAHDDQFTAVGPSNTGSGFSRAAFSNNNQSSEAPQDFTLGVNVQGSVCGVYGESIIYDPNSPNPQHRDANHPDRQATVLTGVFGRGDALGAVGEGPLSGVWGTGLRGTILFGCLGGGQDSQGKEEAVIGVAGAGMLLGVLGSSPSGLSFPNSGLDAGVVGLSASGRGGVFASNTIAQLHLVPAPAGSKLPVAGAQGDLFARVEATATGRSHEAVLYLCVIDGPPAQWKPVMLGGVHLGGT